MKHFVFCLVLLLMSGVQLRKPSATSKQEQNEPFIHYSDIEKPNENKNNRILPNGNNKNSLGKSPKNQAKYLKATPPQLDNLNYLNEDALPPIPNRNRKAKANNDVSKATKKTNKKDTENQAKDNQKSKKCFASAKVSLKSLAIPQTVNKLKVIEIFNSMENDFKALNAKCRSSVMMILTKARKALNDQSIEKSLQKDKISKQKKTTVLIGSRKLGESSKEEASSKRSETNQSSTQVEMKGKSKFSLTSDGRSSSVQGSSTKSADISNSQRSTVLSLDKKKIQQKDRFGNLISKDEEQSQGSDIGSANRAVTKGNGEIAMQQGKGINNIAVQATEGTSVGSSTFNNNFLNKKTDMFVKRGDTTQKSSSSSSEANQFNSDIAAQTLGNGGFIGSTQGTKTKVSVASDQGAALSQNQSSGSQKKTKNDVETKDKNGTHKKGFSSNQDITNNRSTSMQGDGNTQINLEADKNKVNIDAEAENGMSGSNESNDTNDSSSKAYDYSNFN